MEGQAGVLEQGIEPPALDRRRAQPRERVRGDQQEGVEAERQRGLRPERGDQRALAGPPRHQRDHRPCDRQHRHPQQHRPFVIPPRARDLVDERLGAVAVLIDQRDRQIGAREHQQQHRERDQGQRALDATATARIVRALSIADRSANTDQHELERGKPGSEPQRGMTGLGDHRSSVFAGLMLRRKVAELGRHVALVMLGEDFVGPDRRPRPCRSRPARRGRHCPRPHSAALAEQVGDDSAKRDPDARLPSVT